MPLVTGQAEIQLMCSNYLHCLHLKSGFQSPSFFVGLEDANWTQRVLRKALNASCLFSGPTSFSCYLRMTSQIRKPTAGVKLILNYTVLLSPPNKCWALGRSLGGALVGEIWWGVVGGPPVPIGPGKHSCCHHQGWKNWRVDETQVRALAPTSTFKGEVERAKDPAAAALEASQST